MKKNKLFTIGPVQMFDRTLKVRSKQVPYFRNDEFSKLMIDNERRLKNLQFADEDSRVIFLTGSGTAGMEATVMNLFNELDRVLVISGGTFGKRFEDICEIHKVPHDSIYLNYDEELTERHFERFNPKSYTGILVNIHETYTGQLYDINIIRNFARKGNMLLVVDAISSFMCDKYNMSENDIDVTIVSSQKGLCLSPGMCFITLNRRAIDKLNSIDCKSMYFDFKDNLLNMKRGQTPFTPSVGICYELNDMLRYVEKVGIDKWIESVRERAVMFRKMLNYVDEIDHTQNFNMSNAITTVLFNKEVGSKIYDHLNSKYGIIVNPIGGDIGKRGIRVSHVGNINKSYYKKIIKAIKEFFKNE